MQGRPKFDKYSLKSQYWRNLCQELEKKNIARNFRIGQIFTRSPVLEKYLRELDLEEPVPESLEFGEIFTRMSRIGDQTQVEEILASDNKVASFSLAPILFGRPGPPSLKFQAQIWKGKVKSFEEKDIFCSILLTF